MSILKMKTNKLLTFTVLLGLLSYGAQVETLGQNYLANRTPLVREAYLPLPLGAVKPDGFLLKMLELQRDGLTGHLDSIYSVVCGQDNGWLGGNGDGWERGPYWIDGLVPLAYILDDEKLKKKAQEWIEWSLKNQRESGYFGPLPLPKDAPKIKGTQQNMSEDWWPKMVMLKALQQYYTATEDKRVITLMDKYFRYQLENLEKFPLGHWTYWAEQRGGDNLAIVYWLYNMTGEPYLLQLADLIHKQTFNWTGVFTDGTLERINPYPDLHCVNVAQGLKEPVIYYQQHSDIRYLQAVRQGLQSLQDIHGYVNGMYGGDEQLHGNDPTQGSELCSAVEMMYSFESILPITGDIYYADYLEKIAYNVLPTQHNDDFTRKQYYQQVNQVLVTADQRNFHNDYPGSIVYGVTSGYPCCVTNMHQGWPKFVQNLWYATHDQGVAALVFGPSRVTLKVGNNQEVTISEKTDYPFRDEVHFRIEKASSVKFPFHLRIPAWCDSATITINGKGEKSYAGNTIVVLEQTWKSGDQITLKLPMKLRFSRWFEGSIGIERGPLVYALKISEKWVEKKDSLYPDSYFEVLPDGDWNFALNEKKLTETWFEVDESRPVTALPWNLENAPVHIKTTGYQVPSWQLSNYSAGKTPASTVPERKRGSAKEIILVPYGCTTLRIAEFPGINE
jgi:uncharacterized protein